MSLTDSFVGRKLTKYTSFECASQLATSAFLEAQYAVVKRWSDAKGAEERQAQEPLGLGAAASVQTNRHRHGDDEVFIVVRTTTSVFEVHVKFAKEIHSRKEQGYFCDLLCLNTLFAAIGLEQIPLPSPEQAYWSSAQFVPLGNGTVILNPRKVTQDVSLQGLVTLNESGAFEDHDPHEVVLMPGSYNPFHYGHDRCARLVSEITERPVVHELSIANADKGIHPEAKQRLLQLRGRKAAILPNAPLFLDKLKYGYRYFAVGADTASRIIDLKYYGGASGLERALLSFRHAGAHFWVLTRREQSSDALQWMRSPEHVKDLFTPLPTKCDVSSSVIRAITKQLGELQPQP